MSCNSIPTVSTIPPTCSDSSARFRRPTSSSELDSPGEGDYHVRGPRWWAMRVLAGILSRTTGTTLTDTTSGFKANGPRAIEVFAREYPAEYLGDTIEALVLASRSGLVVRQVPVAMRPRLGGTPSQSPLKATRHLARSFLALGFALLRPRDQEAAA